MTGPGLWFRLAPNGDVETGCASGLSQEFSSLVTRISPSARRAHSRATLPLDDLLTNLIEIASWTSSDVEWDDGLRRLVEANVNDAASATEALRDRESAIPGETTLEPRWVGPLTTFQKRDIARLDALNHGANFSVPGAGKTRATLALYSAAKARGEVAKLLIVGPKASYEAWLEEASACFTPALRVSILGEEPPTGAEAIVVNYERLNSRLDELINWVKQSPTMVVLDEAHRMKLGAAGAYGSACLQLAPHARRRLILTGTPAPNGATDLENLFSFVWPGQGRRLVGQAIAGGSLREASAKLKPLFTRTTKSELKLPEVRYSVRPVDLPTLHREIYDALVGQFSARALNAADDFDSLGRITMYLLMAADSPALLATGGTRYEPLNFRIPPLVAPENGDLFGLMESLPAFELAPKYGEVLDIVAKNAQMGRKTLVWSTFVRSLTSMHQLLAPFAPALVTGATIDRDAEIRRFRDDPSCSVLLSNPATLGEGISLHHHCHDAIYIDRDFAAGRFLQSLDRIHRLGLEPGVETRVTILTATGTIDELVASRLAEKLNFMGRILDDPTVEALADPQDESATGLNATDARAILEMFRGASTT